MQKWEYLIFDTQAGMVGGLEHNLTQLGNESWELVAVMGGLLFFKRSKA